MAATTRTKYKEVRTHEREVVQGTDTFSMVVANGGRRMADKLRAVKERTWWDLGERSLVEGKRRKGNRIKKIDVLCNGANMCYKFCVQLSILLWYYGDLG